MRSLHGWNFRLKSALFSPFFLILTQWASAAPVHIKIVATLPSFADIATVVAGGDATVIALSHGNEDPHFSDMKSNFNTELNHAELLIYAGLGLEDAWLSPAVIASRNDKIQKGGPGDFDASSIIKLRDVPKDKPDRMIGDLHPIGNPHFMLDPRNGMLLASALAERLGKIAPSNAEDFKKRAEVYSDTLMKKILEWEKSLKFLSDNPIVTYHQSWTYFSDWLSLEEAGSIEPKPGIPPSPENVVKLIHLIQDKKVKFIFIEPFYPTKTAEHIASESGAKLVVLPTEVHALPFVKRYIDIFESIVTRLKSMNVASKGR